MKIKISELTGPALRYCVAKCENPEWGEEGWRVNCTYPDDDGWIFHPDTDWSQGGPILEREGINTYQMQDSTWQANLDYGMVDEAIFNGPTPLIAAMRCYVASKLGDEVDIPEELC